MTGTSGPPLQIEYDQIDPAMLEALRRIDQTASRHDTPYFLAGATARELLLHHVFGRPPGRRTLDIDFGIAVSDWDHFRSFQAALIEEADFKAVPGQLQSLLYPGNPPVRVDLVPFGGIERPDHTIAWPPDEDIVLRVAGFDDALESAVTVRLDENLAIKVICLPALIILKLLAWIDRGHENRDAPDIYTLLKEYGDAGNEERLYGENVAILEAEGYDVEMAGARLIGMDAARIVSPGTREQVTALLQSDQLMEQLANQLALRSDAEHLRRCELMVTRFRDGFLSELLKQIS
jgi:predicted nucleotidyltransferase